MHYLICTTTHLLSSLGFSLEYSLACLIVLHRHCHGEGSVTTLVPDGEVNVRMLKKDVRTTRLLARDGHMESCTTCGILHKRYGVHNHYSEHMVRDGDYKHNVNKYRSNGERMG